MSFDTLERINLQHFVTLEGFGIAGETRLKYCKSLLFRELNCLLILRAVSVSESQLFFKIPPFLSYYIYIIYIYYYISISYKTQKRLFSSWWVPFF